MPEGPESKHAPRPLHELNLRLKEDIETARQEAEQTGSDDSRDGGEGWKAYRED